MLERLDEIDWASLTHAYGPAVDVPGLIRALVAADAEERERARWSLYGNIFHQGTRYEATKYAVPFLVELIRSPETPERHELVELLAAIAIGFDETWLPEGIPVQEYRAAAERLTGDDAIETGWELDAYDAVREAVPTFRALLAEPDADLVAWAAYALAWFPEGAGASLVALGTLLAHDPPPSTAATALIAIGLLDGDATRVAPALEDTAAVVRVAAAIALARLESQDVPGRAVEELARAAAGDVPNEFVPFLEGDLASYSALSLTLLPPETAEHAADALLHGLTRVRFPRAATFGSAVFRLAFPDHVDEGLRLDDLTPLQQRVVRAVADAQAAWMPRENTYDASFAHLVRSYGLPGDVDEFRAFAGLPPLPKGRRGLLRRLFG